MHLNFPSFVTNFFFSYLGLLTSSSFFFSSISKNTTIFTFIVLVDILNNHIFGLLLFFDRISRHLYRARLEEPLHFLLIIRVLARSTSRQFLELVPIVHYLVATSPTLLQVMENWLARMEITTTFTVFLLVVVLQTTVSLAPLLARVGATHLQFNINLYSRLPRHCGCHPLPSIAKIYCLPSTVLCHRSPRHPQQPPALEG